MLEARKNRLFENIFALYNRNLFRRRFHSMQVAGLEFLKSKSKSIPLIIYANHSSWWDGLVAFEVSRRTGLDAFVMMEEKQLQKLFLFRFLGAFSVIREKPREALRSVEYAAQLLKENPGRTLWIFPQGEILPNDLRPLNFYHGLTRIIEKTGICSLASLAMRYEFSGQFKPEVFVKVGEPELISAEKDFASKSLNEKFARTLTDTLDSLRDDVINSKIELYQQII